MAKIIHTGDIHLDSRFVDFPEDEQRARRESLRNIFSKIVDIANSENVDVLILAGDVFDSCSVRPETADSFLRDLRRAKCRVFITPGNHDPLTPASPYATLDFPENVHIFSSRNLTPVEIPELSLRIYGAAYTSEVYDERILDGFSVENDELSNIVILHSNLYGEGYSPVSASEIGRSGADYVALAHIHKPTDVMRECSTHYAYCGCPEARDFGECYDTAVYIGEIEKGDVSLTRRVVSDIRYREETVDAKDIPDIRTKLPTPRKKEFLRLTVTGESEALNESEIKDMITSYKSVEIFDHTTAPRDIWEGIEDDDLRGVFLRKMKLKLDSATTDEEKEKIKLATRFGIDAIENREM